MLDTAPPSFIVDGDFDGFEEFADAEHMTLGELHTFFRDAAEQVEADSGDWVQFIPLIASAIPAVVQGVSSLVQAAKGKNTRPPQNPATPVAPATPPAAPALPTPAPAAAPVPPATPVAPAQAERPQSLNTLLGLLQNPALQGALQQAGGNLNIPVGKTNIPVSSVLQVIGQLAGALSGVTSARSQEAYPDFLFDSYGKALTDPESPEALGRFFLQQFK